LVPIDFSYTTSYRLSIVTCSGARLATIHNVTDDDDDRQTDRQTTDATL